MVMRVFELMRILADYPAGAEVKLALESSEYVNIAYVEKDTHVHIVGGDSQLYDADGEPVGLVSEMPGKIHEARKLEKLLHKVKLRL